GFLCLGVVARVLSLLPFGERFRFLGPMAATLLMYCPNDCGRLARRSAAGTRMVFVDVDRARLGREPLDREPERIAQALSNQAAAEALAVHVSGSAPLSSCGSRRSA